MVGRDDGERRWRREAVLVAVQDDVVVLRTGEGLVGVDAESGDQRWRSSATGTTVLAGDVLVVGGMLTAVREGSERWDATAQGIQLIDVRTGKEPTTLQGALVAVSPDAVVGFDGEELTLTGLDGNDRWSVTLPFGLPAHDGLAGVITSTQIAITTPQVHGAAGYGTAAALDPRDGSVLWSRSGNFDAPVAGPDDAVVLDGSGLDLPPAQAERLSKARALLDEHGLSGAALPDLDAIMALDPATQEALLEALRAISTIEGTAPAGPDQLAVVDADGTTVAAASLGSGPWASVTSSAGEWFIVDAAGIAADARLKPIPPFTAPEPSDDLGDIDSLSGGNEPSVTAWTTDACYARDDATLTVVPWDDPGTSFDVALPSAHGTLVALDGAVALLHDDTLSVLR